MLPIVLYNGEAPWTATAKIAELIPKAPGLVLQFLPHIEYLLIAENHYREASSAPMRNLVAAMMCLQRPHNQTTVLELIDLLNLWLANNPELMRIFAIWLHTFLVSTPEQIPLGPAQDARLKSKQRAYKKACRKVKEMGCNAC